VEILGKPAVPGRRTIFLGQARLEIEISKIELGYKISGKIWGRPGKLELARFNSPSKYLMNNWQSWGPFMSMEKDQKPQDREKISADFRSNLFTPVPDIFERHVVSDYFLAWEGGLIGFLSSENAHPLFIKQSDEWACVLEYFDAVFEKPVPLESLVIIEGKPVEDLLDSYAQMIQNEHQVRINPWNPIGWCSWYYYFRKIEWADIRENLNIAGWNFPFEVFQVDDGYQAEIGDWLRPQPGFPEIKEIAESIQQAGLTPGIWIAPFSAAEGSRLFKEHPDWMVGEGERPKICYKGWGQKIYALDTTNPEVKQWLFDTFTALSRAGFRYFKIDFLFAGAMPGKRSVSVTPIQAYIQGLTVIRRAVKKSFILGCGAPLLPSVGWVDGMRINEDTAPFWNPKLSPFLGPNAYHALKNSLMRQYLHRRLWLNDPDCLLLRRTSTELTENERKLYALAAGALDNMLIQSDRLPLVDSDNQELFRKAIRLRGGKVEVKGLMEDIFRIESRGGPAGDFILLANLTDLEKIFQGSKIPPRSAVFHRNS